MADSAPKLKVAIVGGGSVGLTFAVYLLKLGKCEVHLFERAAAFTEIGAGIDISANGIKAYREMGLADEVYALSRDPTYDDTTLWFEATYGDGRNNLEPFVQIHSPVKSVKCHRADLLNWLASKLPAENVHLRKQLTRYEELGEGGVKLYFGDGTTFDADVLVGADGIKSTVRALMYADEPEYIEPQWSGWLAYRALRPVEEVVSKLGEHTGRTPTFYLGKNKHIVQFPISNGRLINLVCFTFHPDPSARHPPWPHGPQWVRPSSTQELLAAFEGFDERVLGMLGGAEEVRSWGIFECPRLPSFVSGCTGNGAGGRGRVALIGDAAHASTPHGGNGASQGMEDAHLLASLLSHPLTTRTTLPLALQAYNASRRPRSQEWQERAYATGLVYDLLSPAAEEEGRVGEALKEGMEWPWGVDVKQELRDAVGVFEGGLGSVQAEKGDGEGR